MLGPRFEENFRRAMLIAHGDLGTFLERPISAVFLALALLLIGVQIYMRLRGARTVASPRAIDLVKAMSAGKEHDAPS